jgi:leucyl-tRNA---protein transferase
MISLFQFTSPPEPCAYLPDRNWRLHYHVVAEAEADEYGEYLATGWRRFGFSIFQPRCEGCTACRSLRIPVADFQPNRSQRRAWRDNQHDIQLVIGEPEVTEEKLELYDRFHEMQSVVKDWPHRSPKSESDYAESFVFNPFPTQEWRYYLGEKLVGVGYVDALNLGPSAIYFFYDPDCRERSLGTFNVLSLIERAKQDGLPHVYLGYYVEGCRSLEYKANFLPNEVFVDGRWQLFRS